VATEGLSLAGSAWRALGWWERERGLGGGMGLERVGGLVAFPVVESANSEAKPRTGFQRAVVSDHLEAQ
jgi:hypothetical protein